MVEATAIYCLVVPEAKSPKPKWRQGRFLLEAPRTKSIPRLSAPARDPHAPWLERALLQPLPASSHGLPFWVFFVTPSLRSLSLLSLIRTLLIDVKPVLNPGRSHREIFNLQLQNFYFQITLTHAQGLEIQTGTSVFWRHTHY